MKVARRVLSLVLVLAVLPLVVAACGSSSKSSSSSTGSGGGSTSGAGLKGVDINAKPRDQLKQGGTIRWAVDQYSSQWNYNELDGTSVASATILAGTMPSMFNADDKANLTVNKDYLVDAKLTTSPKQVVTYKINPKAQWSDGKPIDWKDFEAQWKALHTAGGPYQISSSTGYEDIESVKRGADDREAVVTFKKPFADWQSLFSYLYPASTNNDPKVFNKGWLNKMPVTAGPFKLEKMDQTAKTVTIVRDPKWWGVPAKLDGIVTRALAVDAAVNAFVNGEVDVVDVGPDPSAYKRALGAQDGVVTKAAGPDFRHFTFNATSPVMSDKSVRQAVAMGINREAMTKADLTGLDWPAVTLGNHFLVNTQAGYKDNSGDVGKYNPDKAKQMLDQAGWKAAGSGFRQKGGKTLTVRFVIPSGIQLSRHEGELAQAMLKDIGVKLDIVTVPSDAFFDKHIVPGNYDITPFSWIGTPFPVSSGKAIYAKPVKDSKGQLQVQQNYARNGSDEIDNLMKQAIAELDRTKANDLINKADALVWDNVHSLTLYQRPQIWGIKKGLANVGSYGFKTPIYQDIGFVK